MPAHAGNARDGFHYRGCLGAAEARAHQMPTFVPLVLRGHTHAALGAVARDATRRGSLGCGVTQCSDAYLRPAGLDAGGALSDPMRSAQRASTKFTELGRHRSTHSRAWHHGATHSQLASTHVPCPAPAEKDCPRLEASLANPFVSSSRALLNSPRTPTAVPWQGPNQINYQLECGYQDAVPTAAVVATCPRGGQEQFGAFNSIACPRVGQEQFGAFDSIALLIEGLNQFSFTVDYVHHGLVKAVFVPNARPLAGLGNLCPNFYRGFDIRALKMPRRKSYSQVFDALQRAASAAAMGAQIAPGDMPGVAAAVEAQARTRVRAEQREKTGQAKQKETELRQIREAREEEEVNQALSQLQLNAHLTAVCRQKIDKADASSKMLACAALVPAAGSTKSPKNPKDMMVELYSAMAQGRIIQNTNIGNVRGDLEAGIIVSTTLVLDQFTGDVLSAQELKVELERQFPGTKMADNGGRQLGAKGRLSDKAMTITIQNGNKKVQLQRRKYSYMLLLDLMSPDLLTALTAQQPLEVRGCQARLVSNCQALSVLVNIAEDTAPRLRALAAQVAALEGSTADLEAVLLHIIRHSQCNDLVADVLIPRELVPHKSDQEQVDRGYAPLVPLEPNPPKALYATAVPSSLGANHNNGGVTCLWLIAKNDEAKQKLSAPGESITFKLDTGPVTLVPQQAAVTPSSNEWGPDAAARVVQQLASKAAAAPFTWIKRVLDHIADRLQEDEETSAQAFDRTPPAQLSDEMKRAVHPVALEHINDAIAHWSQLKAQGRGRKGSGKPAWNALEQAFTEALRKVEMIDMAVTQASISWRKSGPDAKVPDNMWRTLLTAPGASHVEAMTRQLHKVLCRLSNPPPIAGLALIRTKPRHPNSKVSLAGISGNGAQLAIAGLWSSEIGKFRDAAGPEPEQPNILQVPFSLSGYEGSFKFRLSSHDVRVEAPQALMQRIEEAIMLKLGCGNAIFVPNKLQDGQPNLLTGSMTECAALKEENCPFDIRAEGFVDGFDMADVEHVLMPALSNMIKAGKLAPVASSILEGKDSIAFMETKFARAMDLLQADWKSQSYGQDISTWVTDQLQPSFVQEVRAAASQGLWAPKDMIQEEHEQPEAGVDVEPHMPLDLSTCSRSIDNIRHPFAGDPIARQILQFLIETKAIAVVEVAGYGVVLTLPAQQDLIELLRDNQEHAVEGVGGRIKYESMVATPKIIQKTSDMLRDLAQKETISYFWLLAPADAAINFSSMDDCRIQDQHSAVEKVAPLAGRMLPDSIWSTKGQVFMAALTELRNKGLAIFARTSPSANGRLGGVVLLQLADKSLHSLYGEEIEDDLYNIKVGDSDTLQAALQQAASKQMRLSVKDALKGPKVLRGAQLLDSGVMLIRDPGAPGGGELDLIQDLQLTTENELAMAVSAVELLRQQRRVSVRNCMSGILILPSTDGLNRLPDIDEQVAAWDPRSQGLNELRGMPGAGQQVAAGDNAIEGAMGDSQQQAAEGGNALRGMHGAGQQAAADVNTDDGSSGNAQSALEESDAAMSLDEPLTCMKAAFNVKRGRESEDTAALEITEVDTNMAYDASCVADNVLLNNAAEWAIPPRTGGRHAILTLRLAEPHEIQGIALAHRSNTAFSAFRQCWVEKSDQELPENQLTLTQDRGAQFAWLPQPFISNEIQVRFDPDSSYATAYGTPGLSGVMLFGRMPTGSPVKDKKKKGRK